MDPSPFLEVNKLSFSYGQRPILKNLSFSVKRGEIVTLIGPSGIGKSTLLRVMTGLNEVTDGTITIAGKKMPDCFSEVAYMMQNDLLLPWRTVIRNLTLIAELGPRRGVTSDVIYEAYQLLKEMKLSDHADDYPHQLSGGMRQRVSLVRAIMQKRPLLFLDEPFSSLDMGLREQMHELLRTVQKQHGLTILLVTHDFRDALSLSDRILLLSNGAIAKEWVVDESMRAQLAECPLFTDLRNAMVATSQL